MSRASCVYLARLGDEYKIGVSDNPARRMKELAREYGQPFELIHQFYSPYPFKWESHFFFVFAKQSTGDEFFVLTENDIAIVCRHKNTQYAPNEVNGWLDEVYPYRYDKYLREYRSNQNGVSE